MADKTDPPDLTVHKGNKAQITLSSMRDTLEMYRQQKDIIMEFNKVNAELLYGKYQALRDAGFGERQAMEIISLQGP